MTEIAMSVVSRTCQKLIFLAGDYDFLPEGVRVVKNCFDRRMNEENLYAKIDYNRSNHMFEITCDLTDSDAVWIIAHKLYTSLIHTEKGDSHEPLRSDLIKEHLSHPSEIDSGGEWAEDSVEGGVEDLEPLVAFSVKDVWECKTVDLIMDKIIPVQVQVQIEMMTSTRLDENLNGQYIEVHARSQEDCDRAVKKLDVLRKYHDLARRHVGHAFYNENEKNYELCIQPLLEINNRLVETTLLDSVYTPLTNQELIRACTIRCCPFQPLRNAYIRKEGHKMVPAVLERNQKKGSAMFDLWTGYQYPARGSELSRDEPAKPFHLPHADPTGTREQVRKWLEADFGEQEFTRMHIEVAQGNDQDVLHSSDRKPENSLNNLVSAQQHSGSTENFASASSSRRSTFRNPSMHESPNERNSRPENIGGSGLSLSILDSDIQEEEKSKLSSIVVPAPSRCSQDFSANNPPRNQGFENPHNSQSLLDSDIPEIDRWNLLSASANEERLLGGRLTPDATLLSIREEIEVGSQETKKDALRRDSGNLRASPHQKKAPKLDKGKGRGSPPQLAPTASEKLELQQRMKDYVVDVSADGRAILASLRNYQGEIVLECQLGRLLVKPFGGNTMHLLDKAHSFSTEQVANLLLRHPLKTKFTKALTILPADMQFILDMQIEGTKQRIWSDAVEWTVKYEYICCDHEEYDGFCTPGFVLEIDADTFESKIKSAPVNFGTLNIHCTLRNWDYLLSATGSRDLEEDYEDLVQAIKDTTHIASGSTTPSMSFELSQRHQIHFQSIRVRRQSRYKSFDDQIILNITETHDLSITWEEIENGTRFFVNSSEKPNSTWYEMSLESVAARDAFKENLDLELGEETQWTAEFLLERGVITKDLCVLANYLVTRMDGIGFYNDNGIQELLADMKKAASKRNQYTRRGSPSFW